MSSDSEEQLQTKLKPGQKFPTPTPGYGDDSVHSDRSSGEESNADVSPDYVYDHYPSDNFLFGREKPSGNQLERTRRIELAADNVRAVIQKYASAPLPSLDPNDASNERGWEIDAGSAWADTQSAMDEIVKAREEMAEVWGEGNADTNRDRSQTNDSQSQQLEWWKSALFEGSNSDESQDHQSENADAIREDKQMNDEENAEFEAVYMEWATSAFADELEAMRMGQLEKLAYAERKTKNAPKSGGAASAMELDPTKYSFVVASEVKWEKETAEDEVSAAAEEVDVQVVADMLRSGSNSMSVTEKRMLLRARQRAMMRKSSGGDFGPTPLHERRKII